MIQTRQLVTADGTYATQSALSVIKTEITENKALLRRFLLDGNFFLASSLATTLVKLVFNYSNFMRVCFSVLSCVFASNNSRIKLENCFDI